MGQCLPCAVAQKEELRGHSAVPRSLGARGDQLGDRECLDPWLASQGVYSTLREAASESVRKGSLELSVLRLNFDPSRPLELHIDTFRV